jgi:hypothetical protein
MARAIIYSSWVFASSFPPIFFSILSFFYIGSRLSFVFLFCLIIWFMAVFWILTHHTQSWTKTHPDPATGFAVYTQPLVRVDWK